MEEFSLVFELTSSLSADRVVTYLSPGMTETLKVDLKKKKKKK
jgi:hypothetical protein